MRKKAFWLSLLMGLALVFGLGHPVQAATLTDNQVQQTREWYRDPQGVVGPHTQQALYNANYRAFQKIKGKPQIAVIVTSGKDQDELQDYANEQFKKYGFGHADWDNGLLLTIEPKEHHYWLEVGYGLEPVVPDGSADEIVTDAVKNQLRADQYDHAIAAIVNNTVRRVQKHQSAISTPADIGQRRAQERQQNAITVGLILLFILVVFLMAARFFALRNWIGRTLANKPDTFPILQELHEAGIVIDPKSVPGGGWQLFDRQLALKVAFAKLIRWEYIKWLAAAPQLGPQPYYYYEKNDDRMTDDKWPAAELAAAPSLNAVLTDETERPGRHKELTTIKAHTDAEQRKVGAYQERFERWITSSHAKPEEASYVWQEFYGHVTPEDAKLADDKLAKLWSVLLKHKRHPDLDQKGVIGMPVWVDENYVHSSSPSSSTGGGSSFGSGGGGGASGGGGFGGSW
ncbi:TPM domain-containing protein [Lacticaseibacillus hegangensis]|uniref:TPM domain-containing protein n=1 Tax=Lacticaseibacillus hegangensis TaxID=2486010 RepID=A0ABW4CSY1_9LACO|nr:TPM domain-containing protein [Lacticaseibacillus hegangensis]